MSHKFSFVEFIYRGPTEREYEVEVEYEFRPGSPAILYGDYPQPADPGEVELLSVKHNGAEFSTTAEEEQKLLERCQDRAGEDLAEYAAAEADYRYEGWRDRRDLGDWPEAAE